jgi:hypothetical protein
LEPHIGSREREREREERERECVYILTRALRLMREKVEEEKARDQEWQSD